ERPSTRPPRRPEPESRLVHAQYRGGIAERWCRAKSARRCCGETRGRGTKARCQRRLRWRALVGIVRRVHAVDASAELSRLTPRLRDSALQIDRPAPGAAEPRPTPARPTRTLEWSDTKRPVPTSACRGPPTAAGRDGCCASLPHC